MTESNFEVDIKEFLKKIEKEKQTMSKNCYNRLKNRSHYRCDATYQQNSAYQAVIRS